MQKRRVVVMHETPLKPGTPEQAPLLVGARAGGSPPPGQLLGGSDGEHAVVLQPVRTRLEHRVSAHRSMHSGQLFGQPSGGGSGNGGLDPPYSGGSSALPSPATYSATPRQ
jgi:hypothetical protein